jgi:hypothetical protein
VEVEKVRVRVAGDRERVDDLRRHVHPGSPARPQLAVLEPDRQLAVEHEEELRVACVEMERRRDAARLRAHLDDSELLDVDEQGDAEVALAGDVLGLARLERTLHGDAA